MTTTQSAMQEVAPGLAQLSADVLFGNVWERPGLSKRDRSLITVATLTALYRTGQLTGHINRATGQRGNKRGDRRDHNPHCLLRRMAHRGQRRPDRQGSFRRAVDVIPRIATYP